VNTTSEQHSTHQANVGTMDNTGDDLPDMCGVEVNEETTRPISTGVNAETNTQTGTTHAQAEPKAVKFEDVKTTSNETTEKSSSHEVSMDPMLGGCKIGKFKYLIYSGEKES